MKNLRARGFRASTLATLLLFGAAGPACAEEAHASQASAVSDLMVNEADEGAVAAYRSQLLSCDSYTACQVELKRIFNKLNAAQSSKDWLSSFRIPKVLNAEGRRSLLAAFEKVDANGQPVLSRQDKDFLALVMTAYGADSYTGSAIRPGGLVEHQLVCSAQQECPDDTGRAERMRLKTMERLLREATLQNKSIWEVATSDTDSAIWGHNRIALPAMIRAAALTVEAPKGEYSHYASGVGFERSIEAFLRTNGSTEQPLIIDSDLEPKAPVVVKKKPGIIKKIIKTPIDIAKVIVSPLVPKHEKHEKKIEEVPAEDENVKRDIASQHAALPEEPVAVDDGDQPALPSLEHLNAAYKIAQEKIRKTVGPALMKQIQNACTSGRPMNRDLFAKLISTNVKKPGLIEKALSSTPRADLGGFSERDMWALVVTGWSEARGGNYENSRHEMAATMKVIENRGDIYFHGKSTPNLLHAVYFDKGVSFSGWKPATPVPACMIWGGSETSEHKRAVHAFQAFIDPRTQYRAAGGEPFSHETKYFQVRIPRGSNEAKRLLSKPGVKFASDKDFYNLTYHEFANDMDSRSRATSAGRAAKQKQRRASR